MLTLNFVPQSLQQCPSYRWLKATQIFDNPEVLAGRLGLLDRAIGDRFSPEERTDLRNTIRGLVTHDSPLWIPSVLRAWEFLEDVKSNPDHIKELERALAGTSTTPPLPFRQWDHAPIQRARLHNVWKYYLVWRRYSFASAGVNVGARVVLVPFAWIFTPVAVAGGIAFFALAAASYVAFGASDDKFEMSLGEITKDIARGCMVAPVKSIGRKRHEIMIQRTKDDFWHLCDQATEGDSKARNFIILLARIGDPRAILVCRMMGIDWNKGSSP